MSTLFCAFTPCDKSYSLDRVWAIHKAERRGLPLPAERGNIWGLRLMALQVASLYFWTAYNKSTEAFLSGERMESIFLYYFFGSDYPTFPGFAMFVFLISWGTVLLEYLLVFGLFVRRWQKILIPLAIVFHIGLYVLLPVRTFSATMWVLYLAFIDPNAVHRFIDKLHGYPSEKPTTAD